MARIVTVGSHKGGVGKTTTVLNLGHAFSRLGRRVLLIDADPQGGLAHASNLKTRAKAGLAQALRGEASLEQIVATTRDGLLSVAGAGGDHYEDVRLLEEAAGSGGLGRLLRSLAQGQDLVLVDAPAGTGRYLHGLLLASDAFMGVTAARALSVRGLPALLQAFEAARADQPGLAFEGLLLAMYDVLQQAEADLRSRLRRELPEGSLFKTVIPMVPAMETASQRCIPAALLPEAGRVARAYLELATEVVERQERLANARRTRDDYGLF
jgi:chromosome partitioning protein